MAKAMKCGDHVWIVASAMLFCASQTARAAEFQKSTIPNAAADLITVSGDLAFGDDKKFVDVALGTANAIVVFQSRGGNLIAGIEIGKAIRRHHLAPPYLSATPPI